MRRLLAILTLLAIAPATPAAADADNCARCGVPIGKNPFLKDAWGNRRHLDHGRDAWGKPVALDADACEVCGRATEDGRYTCCRACWDTAVNEPAEVQASAKRILVWMARQKLVFADGPPPIRLVPEGEIDDEHALAGKAGVAELSRMPAFLVGRERREAPLAVRANLPRVLFEHVVAHELMHAWAWLDGQPPHALQLDEGAAEWLGSRWLAAIGTPEARYFARNAARSADHRYGGGLRRTQAYVARHGAAGLVTLLRTRLDFPKGE